VEGTGRLGACKASEEGWRGWMRRGGARQGRGVAARVLSTGFGTPRLPPRARLPPPSPEPPCAAIAQERERWRGWGHEEGAALRSGREGRRGDLVEFGRRVS
jgi:hypothetical protein